MKTKHIYTILLFLIISTISYAQKQPISFLEPVPLNKKSSFSKSQQDAIKQISEKALQTELKQLNTNALNNETLSINLFGKNYTFTKKGTVKGAMGALWHGELKNVKEWGMIWLSYNNANNLNQLIGKVQIENKFYKIQLLESKKEVIVVEEKPSEKIPTCSESILNEIENTNTKETAKTKSKSILKTNTGVQNISQNVLNNNDACKVKVLVLYTLAAATNYDSDDPLGDYIKSDVDITNTILQNSHVNSQIELVGIAPFFIDEYNYTNYEYDYLDEPMSNLSYNALSNLDFNNSIITQRNNYDADIVVIITEYLFTPVAGIARRLTNDPSTDKSETYFYSFIQHIHLNNSSYTFSHELGHLFGSVHEYGVSNPNLDESIFPYSYAINIAKNNNKLSTVNAMSYTDVTIRPYYSNPNVSINYNGSTFQLGNADFADNARTFNQTMPDIAKYRQPIEDKVLDISNSFKIYDDSDNYIIPKDDYTLHTAINSLTITNDDDLDKKIIVNRGGKLELKAKTIKIKKGVTIKKSFFGWLYGDAIFLKTEGAEIATCGSNLSRNIALSNSQTPLNIFQEDKITIYPNPTNNIVNLKWNKNLTPNKIIINDMYGKQIIKQAIMGTKDGAYTLNLKNLSRGIYFLSVYDNKNNLIKSQKIMLVD